MFFLIGFIIKLGEDVDGGEWHALHVSKHHPLLVSLVVPADAIAVTHHFLLGAETGSQGFVQLLVVAAGGGLVDPVFGPLQLLIGAEETSQGRRWVAYVESHSHVHRHYWARHGWWAERPEHTEGGRGEVAWEEEREQEIERRFESGGERKGEWLVDVTTLCN